LNPEFLRSVAARPIRILSEYLEPADDAPRAHPRHDSFLRLCSLAFPEEADGRMAVLRSEIERRRRDHSRIESRVVAGEYAVRMSRYYRDAMELARRVTEWSEILTGNLISSSAPAAPAE